MLTNWSLAVSNSVAIEGINYKLSPHCLVPVYNNYEPFHCLIFTPILVDKTIRFNISTPKKVM